MIEIGLEMKRQLTRVVLIGSMIVQNLCAVASDYSGRHYTDDSSDSSSGLGFLIILALVVGGFIVYGVIQSKSNNKQVNNRQTQSSSSSYKPQTIDDIRRQNAEYLNERIEYLKQKDKEGDAALKGCIWTIITIAIFALISYLSN